MFDRLSSDLCCGCGACFAICSQNAIVMKSDDKGFLYPFFLKQNCVNCNLCLTVCPERTKLENKQGVKEAYVCQHKNVEVLKHSTSGGLFTALSDVILKDGGVVYGALYDSSLHVVHQRAEDKRTRDAMCGSKYVQSDITTVFNCILNDLKDRVVLFSGTPCQVDAVKKYCARSKHINNLLTCDIICFGTPSPKVFDLHIKYLEKKYKKHIVDYQHRPAIRGFQWGCKNDLVLTKEGKELYETAWVNVYRQLFYSGVSKRDCCYKCKYTSLDRVGDITIGDCRQAQKLVPYWNLNNGVSSLIVSTEKGRNLLKRAESELNIKKVDVSDIDQPPLHEHCSLSPRRDLFFETLKSHGYKDAVFCVNKKDFAIRYWIKQKLFDK